MRARALIAAVAAAFVVAVPAASAHTDASYTITQYTIVASDSTHLACELITPYGSSPTNGWPGVILFHGLGQNRHAVEPFGEAFATYFGLASLACDARGTGQSGGKFGLDNARDVTDAQNLYTWLNTNSKHSPFKITTNKIGAFGISLGGGEVWNSAAAGVPFKAIVPAITWTNLAPALNPNNVPKTGLIQILSQLVPLSNYAPDLAQALEQILTTGTVSQAVTSVEAARSSVTKLNTLTVPTLMLQGRHDFLFDIDQAEAAYKVLAGPKKLYIGDLGHAPAANPVAEQSSLSGYVIAAGQWFSHYLASGPTPTFGVQVAHDPWDGTTTSYAGMPATQAKTVTLAGSTPITASGTVTRTAAVLSGGPYETFGDSSLHVTYSGASSWAHLVATVSVSGSSTPITEGAARISAASGTVTIPLMNEAVLLPAGKALVVKLSAKSVDNVNGYGIPIWNYPEPSGAKITIGSVSLGLTLLQHTISH